MTSARWRLLAVLLAAALAVAGPAAQAPPRQPDVIFLPTPDFVVDAMLEIAGVTADDVVYDLGSGDGRIPIAAARDRGARAVGVELDPALVQQARAAAEAAGVADRVRFLDADMFEVDVREATVVTLYLLPSLNLDLRPKLNRELRPGARVVSHQFGMEGFEPDQTFNVNGRRVLIWTIPIE